MIGEHAVGGREKSALEQTHSHKPIKESVRRERVSQSNESKGRMFKKTILKITWFLLFCRGFFACNDTQHIIITCSEINSLADFDFRLLRVRALCMVWLNRDHLDYLRQPPLVSLARLTHLQ